MHWFGSPDDATLSPVLSATEVVKTLQFVSVGAALVEGSEEDGHLRGRQRVRKADKCSAGIAVGRQSLAHDDGGVGPRTPMGLNRMRRPSMRRLRSPLLTRRSSTVATVV